MAEPSMLVVLTRAVLMATIGCCFAAFLLYLIIKPQKFLNATGHKWNAATNQTAIYYHYYQLKLPQLAKVTQSVRKTSSILLEFNFLQDVLLNFGSIFVAAVCGYLLWALRDKQPVKRDQRSFATKAKVAAKRILFFDLYPRRFWQWWCGGLNVLDLLLVLTVLGFSLMWSYFTVAPKYVSIRAQIASKKVKPRAGHLNMLHQTTSSIGTATQVPMLLFFLPVTRNSFLHYIFNTDFGAIVRYHRWLGWMLCSMVLVHGACYYTYWSLNTAGGTFRSYFFKWGNDHSNNLAGSIAAFFMLIIMFTSWSYIRRHFFQVFIRAHAVGYIGFLIFSFIHFWARWYHVAPSMILLALDWIFRLVQWLHPSWVTGRFVTADKSIITLEFNWKKSALPRAGQSMWINTPTGRRSQWHPVSIADVDNSQSGAAIVTAHMKCYGNWTTDMIAQMVQRGKVVMRAEGPYGQPYGPRWNRYNVLVIIAGGIGATPMLGMLRDLVAQRKRALQLQGPNGYALSAFPGKIYLHWSCRGMAEFALLDEELLNAHQEKTGWLDISLYTTRAVDRHGVHTDLMYEEGMNQLVKNGEKNVELAPRIVPLGHTPKTFSAFGFKPAPLEGQGGVLLRIVALTLAFVGAFFIFLVVMSYDKYIGITTGQAKANYKTAILVVVSIFIGGMGLPALLLYPLAIFRNLRSRRNHQSSMHGIKSGDFNLVPEDGRPKIMTSQHLIGTVEAPAVLQVNDGRPDVAAVLSNAVACHSDQQAIGVFAAGPEAMLNSVKLATAALNDSWKKPYLDFCSHAFDL